MFKKVLIANRGEIAVRILRACRALDIPTVAVYSTADRDALHVRLADERVCIGPPSPAASYLNIPAIVSAALSFGADAVHPGYGFLSENGDFAEACQRSGLVFIGPRVRNIRLMGDKPRARRIMEKAGALYIEKYLERARHIEFQIVADQHRNVLHLGERECSVQRRYQKIVEEAPAPALHKRLRDRMGTTAVQAAKAVGYTNVGTIEFLLDPQGRFYFIEMNTRVQVEHPITEMVTGLDIVQAGIRAAAGEPLPWRQRDITFSGHALECRIVAEDPVTMLPSPGTIRGYHAPGGMGIRVESGVAENSVVSVYYGSGVSGRQRPHPLSRQVPEPATRYPRRRADGWTDGGARLRRKL